MRALILEHRHHQPNNFECAATRLKQRTKRETFRTDREKARKRRGIFFLQKREKREEFEFFFSDRANTTKEGGDSSGVCFLEKRQKRMRFTDFWREISRGTSSSCLQTSLPQHARAKNNNTRVLERKETRKTRRKK